MGPIDAPAGRLPNLVGVVVMVVEVEAEAKGILAALASKSPISRKPGRGQSTVIGSASPRNHSASEAQLDPMVQSDFKLVCVVARVSRRRLAPMVREDVPCRGLRHFSELT